MRRRVLGAITVVGIAILLFAPARGAISFSSVSQSFIGRLIDGRFNPSEGAELAQLDCFAEALSAIPDGSDVYVDPIEDAYLSQRLMEIAFPRIRPVTERSAYELYAEDDPPSDSEVISETTCGDLTITVVDGA